jgi:hypothetical protein
MPEGTAGLQRTLTREFISRRRLTVPAVFFRPSTGEPSARDALAEAMEIDLEAWDEANPMNLGARLDGGWIEIAIKADGDAFAHAFFAAAEHLRVDARAAFGVRSITSILLSIEDPTTIEPHLWPRGGKDRHGHWVETRVTASSPATKSAKALPRFSKPLPGSILPEGVVQWRPKGRAAALTVDLGVEDLEPRAITTTNMDAVCRAVAYATLAYWVRTYLDGMPTWDQILTRRVGGWIARLVREGAAINAPDKNLGAACWAPIDNAEHALDLIEFLKTLGADAELKLAYERSERALAHNPDAPIAGWKAIEETFGQNGMAAIRRAMKAGTDISLLEQMSERYVLDLSSGGYIDREAIPKGLKYEYSHDELVRSHENQCIFVGKKKINSFRLYAASPLRTDVAKSDMFPGSEPGAILRHSPVHGVMSDALDWQPEEYRVLNIYRGFAIKPAATINQALMTRIIGMLDKMLGLLTRDNLQQIDWLKKFIAWTIQHPDKKQQVAPIIIGGQGIGKSVFADNLMQALFGELAGNGTGAALSNNNFLITPFIGKLIVFIDEIKLEGAAATNEIKKIIRQSRISGEVKFEHQRDYYIPARVILAANHTDIGLSPEDAVDRAMFFITAWTAENKGMTDTEFLQWTVGLKPFYGELVEVLERVEVRQHLMRYFRDYPCTREELEDLTHSSRNDERVIKSTMSKSREIARALVADGRILAGADITAWFNIHQLRAAILREDGQKSRVEASSVMMEFERAGLIEPAREGGGGYFRFKWGYGKTLQKMGEAHNLKLEAAWETGPGDYDDNPVRSNSDAPQWRGNRKKGGDNRPRPFEYGARRNPDDMDDFD